MREILASTVTPSNDERLKMSNNYFGKSHLGGRKSSTGVAISVFWQLRKLLDKATSIVPATMQSMVDNVSLSFAPNCI